jgi:hypothetical protein
LGAAVRRNPVGRRLSCRAIIGKPDAGGVGSAISPWVDFEPSEMIPMPYLPAKVTPDGMQ